MTITDPYKEIHALREKIAKMYDEFAGTPSERIRHMEEVAELRDEIERLQQLATKRGARMQIMRDWIKSSSEQDDWRQFVYRNPNVVDWFDEDGVPK